MSDANIDFEISMEDKAFMQSISEIENQLNLLDSKMLSSQNVASSAVNGILKSVAVVTSSLNDISYAQSIASGLVNRAQSSVPITNTNLIQNITFASAVESPYQTARKIAQIGTSGLAGAK